MSPDEITSDADKRETSKSATGVTPVRLLRGFGVFLGWLSGSLVGITALFYAIGFLATIASLSFFGLNIFLLGYDTLVYLARGANALMFFALELGRVLIILSPLIVLYPLIRKGGSALKRRLQGPVKKIPFYGALNRSWRGGLYGLLFIYMYFILDRYIPQFNQYLGVEGVLQRATPLSGTSDPWLRSVLCGDGGQLRTNFLILGIVTFLAALVTVWAYRLTRNMRYQQMMLFPFLAILTMFVFMLPGVYGVTFLAQKLSPVTMAGMPGERGKTFYLIGRGSEHVVTWDAATLDFRFFRSATVGSMNIKSPVPIHRIHPGLKTSCKNQNPDDTSGGATSRE